MSGLIRKYMVITVAVFSLIVAVAVCYSYNIQKNISKKIVRLHILANSNSAEDQALKLKVRDRILMEGKEIFSDIADIPTCHEKLNASLPHLLSATEDEIRKNGYNYNVKITTGNYIFPMKTYGNYALPAGEYDALRIEIGKAEGENWWCVMFPPLCFVNGSISQESSQMLSNALTGEELSLINATDGVSFRFKTVDFFQSTLNTLKTAFKK